MNLGEIYVWETDQAIGHDRRRKYHVYLCEADWRLDERHAFLFISSNDYEGDYAISNSDYPFLALPTSYVSCNSIVTYSQAELDAANIEHAGQMTPAHLVELRNAIIDSDTMERLSINIACNALAAAYDMIE